MDTCGKGPRPARNEQVSGAGADSIGSHGRRAFEAFFRAETHPLNLAIVRAFVGQDPFVVWGNGEQVLDWTNVDDVVEGTILAAERVDDGTPLNLGTRERIRVVDAAREILAILGTDPELHFDPSMPTGPCNRVCDPSLDEARIDWKTRVPCCDGIRRTLDGYVANHEVEEVRASLEQRLTPHGA